MLSEDQKYVIKRNIPTVYNVEGKTFNATVVYANQFQMDVFPAIVLQYTHKSDILYRPWDNIVMIDPNYSQEEQTSITATSEWSYSLPHADLNIKRIDGIYNGAPTTFDDYIKDQSTLTFINQKPDTGTDFTVTYDAYYYKKVYGGWLTDLLSINVYATRQQGVNPIIIVDSIATQLYKYFQYTANNYLKPYNMLVLNLSNISNLDQLVQTEDWRRRHFTVSIQHVETLEELSPRILETEVEVDP